MEVLKNTDALLKDDAKIYVTPQFKSFIKSADYINDNKKLKELTVKFLTEEFEIQDVDYDKVHAENEFFYLRDSNEEIKAKYEEIERLNRNRFQLREIGLIQKEAQLKQKLLKKLAALNKNSDQNEADFTEKFEKILNKQNSEFINKLLKKMKKIEVGIGLEFPGSLQEDVTRGHEEQLKVMTNMKPGMEVKVPEKVYHSFMLDDGFMLNFMENYNEKGLIEWYTEFYEIVGENKNKNLAMKKLKCNDEFRTRQRISFAKFFPEGDLLVITSTLPENEKNIVIQVFELTRNKDSVNMEPRHKIQTNGRFADFVRAGGTEYLVFTNDLMLEEEFKTINVMNFEESFVNSKVKPTIEKINLEIKCYKTCNLGSGYIIGEGPKNTLALIDLSAKEPLAYYLNHEGENYFNYLKACYCKTKNVLFVLHNSQNGAIISVFGVDYSNSELILKQNYQFYNDIKKKYQQTFASRYFEVQFNYFENRLDIVDDNQRFLFRYKLNEESQLVEDKDPIKIEAEMKDCSPTFLMTRIEGDLFFLQYFTFSNYMKAYPIKED